MFNWSEFQKLQVNSIKFNYSFRIQVQVYIHNWTYRVQRRVFNLSWARQSSANQTCKKQLRRYTKYLATAKHKGDQCVHRSDTDAVITTEAPPVRVKRVGRGGGARSLYFFLVALARENDSSHFSLLLLRNNTFFRYFGKNLLKIII